MDYNDKRTANETDERNSRTSIPDVSDVSAPGRGGQNKRKIDREEILRQASEPAMRAEKMADSILHIRSAAEFLTERYVPEDKRCYSAESFREGYCKTAQQGAADGAPDGGSIGMVNEASENAAEVTLGNARRTAPGIANGNAMDVAHGNASDVTLGNASYATLGNAPGTSTHVSIGKSNTAACAANGVPCGREIPPLAVPVDFSTLGFLQASADEPVAPDECRIIILRHAQSLGNAKGSFLGHTDLDLTEQGFIQAEMAADFLDATHIHIDKIYSSDLMRAFHTALPSARRRGLLLSTTKELREVYMGKWEGRVVAELDAEYPEEFGIGWRQHFGTCVLPEGESVPHAARRIYDFVVSRAKENLGKTVMFTSHAAAIRSFWGLASGVPFGRMAEEVPFPGNASFSTMLWKSDGQGDGSLTPCEFSIDGYLGDLRQIKHS